MNHHLSTCAITVFAQLHLVFVSRHLFVAVNFGLRNDSHQNYAHILRIYFLDPPIIQIVVQIAITDLELELFEEFLVLVNIKSIKHIISFLLSYDERIRHQFGDANCIRHEIIRIGNIENLVSLMSKNRTW